MTGLVLPSDPALAFDHLAGYGLAAILEAEGAAPRLAWSDELETHLVLSGATWDEAGTAVVRHAQRALEPSSWVQADGMSGGGTAGLFSPRVAVMGRAEVAAWYEGRNRVVDGLIASRSRLDLAMIGALGEPSYWSFDRDSARPDFGASRWEMKTRNQGQEFVTHRLRRLATIVAARDLGTVLGGLRGDAVVDEDAGGRRDSRTPTGLMPPGPVDSARAWCALWGLSLFAVVHRRSGPSRTAGHAGSHTRGVFYLPVMTRAWPLPRLRSVLRSASLSIAATGDLPSGGAASPAQASLAWEWLRRHGAQTVVRFPVFRSANVSAPERWAERGELIHVE